MQVLLILLLICWGIKRGICWLIDWVICGKQKTLSVNISSVSDIEQIDTRKSLFRPSTFDEYIGQDKAKNQLKDYIRAVRERNITLPHTIISGLAGGGKTTLAIVIAKQLNVNFVETIASSIRDVEALRELIEKANGGILFVDELHGMERDLVETIYTAMEDFKIDGILIKPFTLIGATTELGEIIKDRKPFYERFEIRLKLEQYNYKDLTKISEQFKNACYPDDDIENNVYEIIGRNSKGAPRTAIRFTKATVLFGGNVGSVLKNNHIIKEGYTHEDLKTLEYIAENEKGVGINGLISFLNTSKTNYSYEIEPCLVQNRLIQRTPRGRLITKVGLLKIKELKEV